MVRLSPRASARAREAKLWRRVVDPHVLKARLLADAPPGALQVSEVRAGEAARDDPGIVLFTGNG